jgi:hypothetical protein
MSNASLHSESNTLDEPNSAYGRVAARIRNTLPAVTATIRAAGFWTAVTLPFLYTPLLVAGLGTTQDVLAFLALLLVNLAALFVGRNHAR